MSNDIEVLEIGADGAFEIKSTETTKQRHIETSYDTLSYPVITDDEERLELINKISNGEYKIYKTESNIYIILRLNDGDSLEEVEQSDNECLMRTNNGKKYSIPYPSSITMNPKSATCTVWNDIVSLSYDLV